MIVSELKIHFPKVHAILVEERDKQGYQKSSPERISSYCSWGNTQLGYTFWYNMNYCTVNEANEFLTKNYPELLRKQDFQYKNIIIRRNVFSE